MSRGTDLASQLVNDHDALAVLREHLGNGYQEVRFLQGRGDDLGHPTKDLVADLNLLESDADVSPWKTPFGKQVITAGATAMSKISVGGFSLAGLGAAVYTFYEGFPATGVERLVLWACATVLLAVAGLAVAIIARADLTARATATAAEYTARAQVASAYLNANEDLLHDHPAAR